MCPVWYSSRIVSVTIVVSTDGKGYDEIEATMIPMGIQVDITVDKG